MDISCPIDVDTLQKDQFARPKSPETDSISDNATVELTSCRFESDEVASDRQVDVCLMYRGVIPVESRRGWPY